MKIGKITYSVDNLKKIYNENNRFYHNWGHIEFIMEKLNKYFGNKLTEKEIELLKISILFHDIIYDVHENDNEWKSFEFFKNSIYYTNYNSEDLKIIENLIMVTKTLIPNTELERIILFLDWSIFLESPQVLSIYNLNIFKEYQEYNFLIFSIEREKFFNSARNIFVVAMKNKELIEDFLIEKMLKGIESAHNIFLSFKPKIGVYAGSFNPFHIGHLDILKKAEKIFDKVIIVQAINTDKSNELYEFPKLNREIIREKEIKFIGDIFDELRSKFEDNLTLIRGIRTGHDLIDEQAYHKTINYLGFKDNIVHILSEPEFQHISSFMIRGALKISENSKKWIV